MQRLGGLARTDLDRLSDPDADVGRDRIALVAEAQRDQLTLVTTEKDLARLRGMAGLAADIVPFAVKLEFDDAVGLRKFIADRLFKAREQRFSGE